MNNLNRAIAAVAGVHVPAAFAVPPRVKPELIDNTEIVAQFKALGGRIFHLPPTPVEPGQKKNRGVTFAFKLLKGRVEFATAVQHRNDDFTRKMGTKTAVTHFLNGQTVFLPLPCVKNAVELQRAFRELIKWGL